MEPVKFASVGFLKKKSKKAGITPLSLLHVFILHS
jgi:hypothetical protein